MNAKSFFRGITLLVLCALAVKANYYLNVIVHILKLPLFLDTVFTCAVTFAGGLVPGLIVVVFTAFDVALRDSGAWPFTFCCLGEVLLICLLRPKGGPVREWPLRIERGPGIRFSLSKAAAASFISTFAVLLFLYVASCVTVSVLGGIIDFVLYDVLAENKPYYSPEDTFKVGFLYNGSPIVLTNILSRLPINIVDRFIAIFGGFLLSLPVKKLNWFFTAGKGPAVKK